MVICPAHLRNGVCTNPNCNYSHSLHLCELCNVSCPSAKALQQHMEGKAHKKAAQSIPPSDRCTICQVPVPPGQTAQHEAGQRHQQNVLTFNQQGSLPTPAANESFCPICHLDIRGHMNAHKRTKSHRKKAKIAALRAALEESEKDKENVTVTGTEDGVLDFGLVDVNHIRREGAVHKILAARSTDKIPIKLIDVQMDSSRGGFRPTSFVTSRNEQHMILGKNRDTDIKVFFRPHGGHRGRYSDRIILLFWKGGNQFSITRRLEAIVGVLEDHLKVQPIAPYVPPTRRTEFEENVIPGVMPDAFDAVKWVVPLRWSGMPPAIPGMIDKNPLLKNQVYAIRQYLGRVPNKTDTYTHFWKTLLYIEEHQSQIDMEMYDLKEVTMEHRREYYILDVPGLSEKRPDVLVGNRVNVRNFDTSDWFEGIVHNVHNVRQNAIELRFHPSFDPIPGQKHDVHFKLNTIPLRRMHQALDVRSPLRRLLQPTENDAQRGVLPTPLQVRSIRPINRLIGENPPQHLAVASIVLQPAGSIPFIIFGPPGTGKTVTAVESIRQILLRDSSTRILACAPSNSAADIIAERLTDLGSELFRLNAPSRVKSTDYRLPARFTRTNAAGRFIVPPLEELVKFRVIVTTCGSSAVLYGVGMPNGHFSHVFVDEAGQALEPEAIIAIKTLGDDKTNLVLSGDPKQLGPVVRSKAAETIGLQQSYLERLIERAPYKEFRASCVVKLTKNFRSHPAILKFPNEQFYKGELVASADPVLTHSLLRSEILVKPGFPIVFHSITGKDMRQGSSPSFFNGDEASLVKEYVARLKRIKGITDDNIGVITPYNGQCAKIRTLIGKFAPGVKVGSVELFQGQERRVIIVSTVRSNDKLVDYDLKHTLGFVANPRRFNVAMTRAQALLIVIGDADVLGLDDLWCAFMNYINQNGGWTGKQFPKHLLGQQNGLALPGIAMQDMDQLTEQLTKGVTLRLKDESDHPAPEVIGARNEEKPWRDGE